MTPNAIQFADATVAAHVAALRDELAYLLDNGPEGPTGEEHAEHAARVASMRESIARFEAPYR